MKRREFLKISSAAGLMSIGGVRLTQAQSNFSGPYWLFIEARGGWDPTIFCDPKGAGKGPNGDINDYDESEIGTVGAFSYAPPPAAFPGGGGYFPVSELFINHYQRMVVVNGIDIGTNSHVIGRRAAWGGTRSNSYPALPALIASVQAPDFSLPFVANSNDEISRTEGVVPQIVLNNGDLEVIREVAFPNRSNINNADESNQYFSNVVNDLIATNGRSRRQRQIGAQRLLRLRNAEILHDGIRSLDATTIGGFVDNLENPSAPNTYVNSRNSARDMFEQAQRAFAAFEAGAAATAQINMGNFDTHTSHYTRHYPRLTDFAACIDNIIQDATDRGIADNLILVIGSDFARTNKINSDNGKDHWPHSSAIVWGAPAFVNGNRLIGATDDNQVSRRINPNTLAVDDNGIEITPELLHQALRKIAGIQNDATVTNRFPLAEPVLPIFI